MAGPARGRTSAAACTSSAIRVGAAAVHSDGLVVLQIRGGRMLVATA